jgi:hypothetical protein
MKKADKLELREIQRQKELEELTAKAVQYEFTVVFTREMGDDISCGGKPLLGHDPLPVALRKQFIEELQAAYTGMGIAGTFKIVAGPSLKLDT